MSAFHGSIAAVLLGWAAVPACADTFNYTGTIETYTVQATGLYSLTAFGASGGNGTAFGDPIGGAAGLGAEIAGTVNLTAGDVLTILVGGVGTDASHARNLPGLNPWFAGGGGGGTFVLLGGAPLIVAGGGGGGDTGQVAFLPDHSIPPYTPNDGGAGLITPGQNPGGGLDGQGGFVNGGAGGTNANCEPLFIGCGRGGFGGGGVPGKTTVHGPGIFFARGGTGGGYGLGAGTNAGGGSFFDGAITEAIAGANAGNGRFEIDLALNNSVPEVAPEPATWALMIVGFVGLALARRRAVPQGFLLRSQKEAEDVLSALSLRKYGSSS